MNEAVIYNLRSKYLPDHIGNKARNLQSLLEIRNIRVPETWVVPWDVYEKYETDENSSLDQLDAALQAHLDHAKFYAVRSSSNIEDASFNSYAGLFKTFLNVQGFQNIRNAIIQIWEATHDEAIQAYLDKLNLSPDNIHIAVILQEMVLPVYSGVLFSRNPMTGLSETVIEVVPGYGTALVQDGVTPERWVSRKGFWVAKPDEYQVPIPVMKQVLDESRKILKTISKPIDLEWVYDGQVVYWVQMREITTIKDLHIYSNRFSKDVMPGMIHPLIWSINVPLINTVWLGLLEKIVGKIPIDAEGLAKSFFYRSYFNMGAIGEVFARVGFPSEGLEMIMGLVPNQEGKPAFKPNIKMIPLVPRLLGFIIDKWNFEHKIKSRFSSLKENLVFFTTTPQIDVPLEEQIREINDLYHLVQKIIYFNVVTPILASVYTRLLEQQLSKLSVDLLTFDTYENLHELDQYNPNIALMKLHKKFDLFLQKENFGRPSENRELSQAEIKGTDFEDHFNQFIRDFGYLSSNGNNFTAVPWRENPDAVLEMIRDFQMIDREKSRRISFEDLPARGLRKWLVKLFYKRVRKFSIYREQISRSYYYGYGLFRSYFLRLANGMISKGWLESKEDIFFLTWDEIQRVIETKDPEHLLNKITARQEEMEAYRDVDLPDVIYGDEPPPVFSGSFDRLRGTPTSQGYYSGPLKIVSGMEEFHKVNAGDVIVIPYSDVGWTPLFSLAGAVIAESGGLLSHSSIIAREYQIPAVVSVPNCMRLRDMQRVSVNGFTGEIVLLDQQPGQN